MAIKWKLVDNKTLVAEDQGYQLVVKLKAAFGSPYWAITKDGVIVDVCFSHPPTKCELSARVQAERVFTKLINPST